METREESLMDVDEDDDAFLQDIERQQLDI